MKVCNLKSYLANIGMTLKHFCEIIDCDDKHMSRVMNGKKNASRRLAKDILEATSGVIKLETRIRKRYQRRQNQQQEKEENNI